MDAVARGVAPKSLGRLPDIGRQTDESLLRPTGKRNQQASLVYGHRRRDEWLVRHRWRIGRIAPLDFCQLRQRGVVEATAGARPAQMPRPKRHGLFGVRRAGAEEAVVLRADVDPPPADGGRADE